MKTSIATVSISGTLPDKLGAIAAAGFDGVEIFENDFLTFDAPHVEVGRMVRDYGLEITLFQPFRDFEGMPEPYRQRTFDRAERKFDVMQSLGADMLLVCSNLSSVCLKGIDRAAQDFHDLGERAARRGIKVGFEALAWGRHIYDHRDAWDVVRRAAHPNVGLILDSFHSLARKIDIASLQEIPKDKIFIVQLADAPLIDMDLLYWSRHFRNMPGEGSLPVKDFVSAIVSTGYDGYFSLEIFNDQFRGGSPRLIANDGYRSLLNINDDVRRECRHVAGTLPEMPPRAKVNGISFVEFSTNGFEADKLATLLRQLGFRKTAKHKSKNVYLYRQGDIRLIINMDNKGFSNLSFAVHGTMAYVLALHVDDAQAAFKRATALGITAFEQAVAEGETQIPAIRGLGGGIIYFIDEQSELGQFEIRDFTQLDANDPVTTKNVGLQKFDHIAQTVGYDEMLTWLLFYSSLFEAHKTPMTDIIDPAGVVRSQVIETDSGSLRITINGAENRRTFAGHFIAEKFGAGIQHLAFSTSDIFETEAALRQNGFKTLKISPNYYDDIEARFGLDPQLSDRLREKNILYDRDEYGEYFQLYNATYGEGFFFEIVQRNGYRGYGSSNAAFRIAAQKKQIRPEGMPKI